MAHTLASRTPARTTGSTRHTSTLSETHVPTTSRTPHSIRVGRAAVHQKEHLRRHSNRIFVSAECALPQPSTLTAFELYTGGCAPTREMFLLVFALPQRTYGALFSGGTADGPFDARVVSVTRVSPTQAASGGLLNVALATPLDLRADNGSVYLLGFAFGDEHCGPLLFSFSDPLDHPHAEVHSTALLPQVANNVTLGAAVRFPGDGRHLLRAEFALNAHITSCSLCQPVEIRFSRIQ